jgi:hypothetical protein
MESPYCSFASRTIVAASTPRSTAMLPPNAEEEKTGPVFSL